MYIFARSPGVRAWWKTLSLSFSFSLSDSPTHTQTRTHPHTLLVLVDRLPVGPTVLPDRCFWLLDNQFEPSMRERRKKLKSPRGRIYYGNGLEPAEIWRVRRALTGSGSSAVIKNLLMCWSLTGTAWKQIYLGQSGTENCGVILPRLTMQKILATDSLITSWRSFSGYE